MSGSLGVGIHPSHWAQHAPAALRRGKGTETAANRGKRKIWLVWRLSDSRTGHETCMEAANDVLWHQMREAADLPQGG
ncbi:hypothetical protein XELAEV_18020183mg [Xenopus laevis]|uniref:Uncharacterized protein n=1 Tax=Xenopus laevis TaxID=8355 RepID=A0A974D6F0_XENLA|nr:hypothetical protein XELAEV_18020183mg [Xenopus laevis]